MRGDFLRSDITGDGDLLCTGWDKEGELLSHKSQDDGCLATLSYKERENRRAGLPGEEEREVRSGRELSGGRRGSKREGIGPGEGGKTLQLYATLATEVYSIVKYILQETLSKRSFYHLTEWFFPTLSSCPNTYFLLLSGPTESFYQAGLYTGAS